MDLSVITVTWNSAEFIANQIISVKKACKNVSYEHFIIDNASSDGTVEIIEKNFPEIKLIKSSSNLGFAIPNNLAAKQAQGKFFLFLNPDMRLEEESLDKMVVWMNNYLDVGIAGCKLVSEENQLRSIHKPTKFPTLTSLSLTALKISVLFPQIMNRYSYTDVELNQDKEVDAVRGSFLLMRRAIIEKLGFTFDPRYFIWFEDVDICRETKRLGYKVMFTPIISCIDYAGQSFKKQNLVKRQKQFFKSAIIYLKKWEPGYKSMILWMVQWFGIEMVWIYSKIGGELKMKDAIER
jgi:GT2 family glycosyltransferase